MDKIVSAAAKDLTAPSGSQWHNGLSEGRVKMLKSNLEHMHSKSKLNNVEFKALLKATFIINKRPLRVCYHGER